MDLGGRLGGHLEVRHIRLLVKELINKEERQ